MFESGAPTCKFSKIGDVHKGKIVDCKERQQTDMDTGEPESWPDGNPKMMVVMTIQTAERDPEVDGDDGTRKVYMKRPSGIYNAFIGALKTAKCKPVIGGTVAFKYIKDGVPPKKGYNAPKEFAAVYAPPGQPLATTQAATPTAPTNLNDGAKRQARIEAMTKFKSVAGPTLPKETLLAAWAVAVEGYFGIGTNEAEIKPAQWQNFILNDFAPATNPISDSPDPALDDVPF
jgi:hypothetical protein